MFSIMEFDDLDGLECLSYANNGEGVESFDGNQYFYQNLENCEHIICFLYTIKCQLITSDTNHLPLDMSHEDNVHSFVAGNYVWQHYSKLEGSWMENEDAILSAGRLQGRLGDSDDYLIKMYQDGKYINTSKHQKHEIASHIRFLYQKYDEILHGAMTGRVFITDNGKVLITFWFDETYSTKRAIQAINKLIDENSFNTSIVYIATPYEVLSYENWLENNDFEISDELKEKIRQDKISHNNNNRLKRKSLQTYKNVVGKKMGKKLAMHDAEGNFKGEMPMAQYHALTQQEGKKKKQIVEYATPDGIDLGELTLKWEDYEAYPFLVLKGNEVIIGASGSKHSDLKCECIAKILDLDEDFVEDYMKWGFDMFSYDEENDCYVDEDGDVIDEIELSELENMKRNSYFINEKCELFGRAWIDVPFNNYDYCTILSVWLNGRFYSENSDSWDEDEMYYTDELSVNDKMFSIDNENEGGGAYDLPLYLNQYDYKYLREVVEKLGGDIDYTYIAIGNTIELLTDLEQGKKHVDITQDDIDKQEEELQKHLLPPEEKWKATSDWREMRDKEMSRRRDDELEASWRAKTYQESKVGKKVLQEWGQCNNIDWDSVDNIKFSTYVDEYDVEEEVQQMLEEKGLDSSDEAVEQAMRQEEYQPLIKELRKKYLHFDCGFYDEDYEYLGEADETLLDEDSLSYSDIDEEFIEMILNEYNRKPSDDGEYRIDDIKYNRFSDCDDIYYAAKKLFPTYSEYQKGLRGFILSDGTIIGTEAEHNMCSQLKGVEDKFDFISMGNIRIMPNSIDIGKEPTFAQEEVLRDMIRCYWNDELYLDVWGNGKDGGCRYYQPYVDQVIADIDRYYSEGIVPTGEEWIDESCEPKKLDDSYLDDEYTIGDEGDGNLGYFHVNETREWDTNRNIYEVPSSRFEGINYSWTDSEHTQPFFCFADSRYQVVVKDRGTTHSDYRRLLIDEDLCIIGRLFYLDDGVTGVAVYDWYGPYYDDFGKVSSDKVVGFMRKVFEKSDFPIKEKYYIQAYNFNTSPMQLREGTERIGIYINCDSEDFDVKISRKEKTIETRNTNSLKNLVNQRVGLVKTHNDISNKDKRNVLFAYATIGEPIPYTSEEKFVSDTDKHRIEKSSSYFIKNKKYGYPLIDIEAVTPRILDNRENRFVIGNEGKQVPKQIARYFNEGKTIFITKDQLKMIKENINVEVRPDEVDLSSFEVEKTLYPKLWNENNELDSRARLQLLDIADDFMEYLNIRWVTPKDVRLTGSICNYNWSKFSDIDMHIVIDFKEVDNRTDLVEEYFNTKKNEWNDQHTALMIYGLPVELYVEDVDAETKSSGIYSLDKNEWISEPDPNEIKPIEDGDTIRETTAELMTLIDDLNDKFEENDDKQVAREIEDTVDTILKFLKEVRKASLEKDGEMADGNIDYKLLRRFGYLDKLYDLSNKCYDKINSIEEL